MMKFSRMKTFLVIFVLSMGSTGLANTSIEHSALVSGVRFSADGTKLMLWTEGDSEGDLTVRDILSGQDQIFKTGEIISGGDETGFCYANQVICLDNGFSFTFVNLKNEKQYHLWGDPIISANGRYVMGVDGYYGSELHVLDLETDTKTQIQFNGRDKFSFSPLSTKMMLVSDATESLVVDLSTGDEKIFPVWNSHFISEDKLIGMRHASVQCEYVEVQISTDVITPLGSSDCEFGKLSSLKNEILFSKTASDYSAQEIFLLDLNTAQVKSIGSLEIGEIAISDNLDFVVHSTTAKLLQVRTGKILSLYMPGSSYADVSYSADMSRLVVEEGMDLYVFKTEDGQRVLRETFEIQKTNLESKLTLLQTNEDDRIKLLDLVTGQTLFSEKISEDADEIEMSNSGAAVFYSWDLEPATGTLRDRSSGYGFIVPHLKAQFAPPGNWVALYNAFDYKVELIKLPLAKTH